MSNPDVKKSLKQFVSSKIKARNEKIKSAGDDLEEQRFVLTDYDLFFKGAVEALAAANVDEEDQKAVQLAQDATSTELKSLEQRIQLAELLDSDED